MDVIGTLGKQVFHMTREFRVNSSRINLYLI